MALKDHTMICHVKADWEAEAGVWVATSDDVPGLVAEAATVEELFDDIRALIPELLVVNGVRHAGRIVVSLTSERSEAIELAA
jgi:predicted RNase H-like HicB family nuclease